MIPRLHLTILLHPQESRIGDRVALPEGPSEISRRTPDFHKPTQVLGKPLGLPCISRKPFFLIPRAREGVLVKRDEHGTKLRVNGVSLKQELFVDMTALSRGVVITLAEHLVLLLHFSDLGAVPRDLPDFGLVGFADEVVRIRHEIQQVADLDVPVLIRGETGVGKELVAQAIHQHGHRSRRPFITVNLGALPSTLAAAELFGAKRGSFTGATQDRSGYFVAADSGVLFLDEIGEAPEEVQAMLLRALETLEVTPLGGQRPVSVDVRVLAATDADLERDIQQQRFKAPLLHRLSGFELLIPPLRERPEDLGLLFTHFSRGVERELGIVPARDSKDPFALPRLPVALMERFVANRWSGNIRQFRNLVRRLHISNRGREVLEETPQISRLLDAEINALPLAAPPSVDVAAKGAKDAAAPKRKPRSIEENELLRAMEDASWEPKVAAEILGISRASVYDLIRRGGTLRVANDFSEEELRAAHQRCNGNAAEMSRQLKVSVVALTRRLRGMGLE
ncbi:sigma 54-interacting transcriptional regulator [Acanthopleuribacter pedis]|uniref:Sigma-54-dependent Fis family transcriptional regulator n=1 Tax=Acanthopleuribacter pedis TaxID=442870 RepID=A0A8J7U3V2_9BACT|nr:sigma 54-interacting transcriptional regulator [Acanthopleuribacter pedis]MBO1319154.1 sigma-54-dependent Fis family transcriptional regulator [Acanthopleuribacter pedis]